MHHKEGSEDRAQQSPDREPQQAAADLARSEGKGYNINAGCYPGKFCASATATAAACSSSSWRFGSKWGSSSHSAPWAIKTTTHLQNSWIVQRQTKRHRQRAYLLRKRNRQQQQAPLTVALMNAKCAAKGVQVRQIEWLTHVAGIRFALLALLIFNDTCPFYRGQIAP